MRILHLSDIHIRKENDIDFKHFILNPLLSDLREIHQKKAFDMVALTGDIVDKGGIAFVNRDLCYKTFCESFVDPVIQELSIQRDRFFFVPGNHDVCRENDSKVTEMGLLQVLNNIEAVNEHIDGKSEEGIKRIIPFKTFEKDFYKTTIECQLTMYHSLFKIYIDSLQIGIACLNSAWRSYSESTDRHNLIIGERQLIAAKDYFSDCFIKIALLHHPLDWLSDFDSRCVDSIIGNTFNLVLCGHIHSGSSWVKSDIYKGNFVSIAPCNWVYGIRNNPNGYANGYSIIDYNPLTFEIEIMHRRYSYSKDSYVPNNDFGNDLGMSYFKLPSTKELQELQYENNMSVIIRNSHYSELNEHLLTYNTDTKAPKDIQSLFVFPRIVEKVQFKDDKKYKENPLSIEDICSYESNQIIFGVKESGKTLLLDEILIHFTENLTRYRYIPFFVDFKKITASRLETLIARYLSIGITSINNLLSNHRVVMIVDNLTFTEYDKKLLNILEQFLIKNKNVKMIGCSQQPAEGGIPVELYEYPFYSSFRKLHIKSFGSTETRQLIKKWFSTHTASDVDNKIENLLDTMLRLNLPRTPLAISMFLWILEQQENYAPINNATMLENFIDKLLTKHARKEIYSDKFDFKNKIRLLAEIAHYMLRKDLENYSLTSRELIDFIDDNLKAKKFDFIQANDVLDHFIDKGIFIEEYDGLSTYVRFRFSCFMHYSLMKKMEFDPEFKEYILQPNNFLMFPDEIELYTGTKRDSIDILDLTIHRMEEEFKLVLKEISSLPNAYDEIFSKHSSVIAYIDDEFLSRLSEMPKPSQTELDIIRDEALEKIQIEKGIRKKIAQLSKKMKMELYWTLSAKILKNTEETTIPDYKYNTYLSILKCSMAYAFLWKIYIERFIEENANTPNFKLDEELTIQIEILPLIHELWLRMLLGTTKLSVVFREKIENDEKNDISDFEKFITVFLYADIHGKDSNKYIRKFIKGVRNPHLVDMTLFKLIGYYFLRSKTKESDRQYENMIGDLIVNAQGLTKNKKSKIIQKYRQRRLKFAFDPDRDN